MALEKSAAFPMAVLLPPVVEKLPALCPTKVLEAIPQQVWMNGTPPRLITPTPALVVEGRFRAPPSVPLPSMLKFAPTCVVVVFWIKALGEKGGSGVHCPPVKVSTAPANGARVATDTPWIELALTFESPEPFPLKLLPTFENVTAFA